MRLDFNVLWIDDQPKSNLDTIEAFKVRMREQGFEFRPTICKSPTDVSQLIVDDIFRDEIDLILVDYDLGAGGKGQDVILDIRSTVQYKDVVFYSSYKPPAELREEAFNIGVEGVYCISKGDIVNEVMGVFEALVKKVLDLDHTRGIVMGATSDIDRMVQRSLELIHDKSGSPAKKFLLHRARSIIKDRIDDLAKKAKQLAESGEVAQLLEAHSLFGAQDRLRVLCSVLEGKEYRSYTSLLELLKVHINDVLPIRNDLGHVVLVPAEAAGVLSTAAGKPVTLEEMRKIRVALLELRSEIRKLMNALDGS